MPPPSSHRKVICSAVTDVGRGVLRHFFGGISFSRLLAVLYCLSSCTLLPPPPPSPPNWVCINSTDQLQLLLLLPCNYWAVVVCTKAC